MRRLLGTSLVGLWALVWALGLAGSAGAATIPYAGTLSFGVWTLPGGSVTGSGLYVGPLHISTIGFAPGQFGPVSASLPARTSGSPGGFPKPPFPACPIGHKR